MAEGLARHILDDKISVQSAGSKPSQVNPLAIQVLQEFSIDISGQRSKSVEEIDPKSIDTVITLCAEEVCPVFLGKAKRIHWPLPDPASADGSPEDQLNAFRKTRDLIKSRLETFAQEILL